MNTSCIALLAGLALSASSTLANPPEKPSAHPSVPSRRFPLPPLYAFDAITFAPPNAVPAADFTTAAAVELAPVRVVSVALDVVRDVDQHNAQVASMQTCALVKHDLPGNRQLDFFVAPIRLDHNLPGFPLELYRF